MMDFEEWFESRDDIGCLIGLEGYAAEEAWNARQAEIDVLKAELAKYQRKSYKLVHVCKHEWSIQLSGRYICDLCGEFNDFTKP